MAGWGADLGGIGALCEDTQLLWDGDQDQAYVTVVCRLPKGHDYDDHYDPTLDLSWPQEAAVGA